MIYIYICPRDWSRKAAAPRTLARNHYSGGGHDNASGGRSEVSMEDTIPFFLSLLPVYKNELEKSNEKI